MARTPARPSDPYIDPVAIERTVHGDAPYPALTAEEAEQAVRELAAAGAPTKDIARRLGQDPSTIRRRLMEYGLRRPAELMPCPSRAAYLRHLRRGEDCAPCRAANAAADRAHRAA